MPEQAPVDFGSMFRQARERRGLSLQQVATVTKISARVLEALERNDVSKLPGGIFSRAFVRSYAREIGLDPEMVIERFTAEFPDQSGREEMPSAKDAEDIEAFASGRRVATTVLQLVVLSIVVLVVALFALNSRACNKPKAAGPATSTLQAPAPSAAPVAARPASPPPAPADSSTAAIPDSNAAALEQMPETQQPKQPQEGAARVSTQAAPRIEFTLAAHADCWLMVKVDSSVVFERLMRAGENFSYQAARSVTLSAGNAGGLVLTLNGKPARPLGTSGQVVTTTITLETMASFLQ